MIATGCTLVHEAGEIVPQSETLSCLVPSKYRYVLITCTIMLAFLELFNFIGVVFNSGM